MEEWKPDIYVRVQLLLDNWNREVLKLDVEIRKRLKADEPCEWLIGLADTTKVKRDELDSVLRGNCPPSKGETKMLPEGKAEGGKSPTDGPPPPHSPFHLE